MNSTKTEGVTAQLVYDGGAVYIPLKMGMPRGDQMQGTPAEQLTELAGRVCYDSLGKGRASFSAGDQQGYHDHIREVKHGSVQEHFNFTVEMPLPHEKAGNLALLCCNRPGVVLLPGEKASRLTLNLRAASQWLAWSKSFYSEWPHSSGLKQMDEWLAATLSRLGHGLAPHVIDDCEHNDNVIPGCRVVAPENDHECWVSMYMTGSRGLSHELVRHGDFTAISQRSTRYVDESEGAWVAHPLVADYRRRHPGHWLWHEQGVGTDDLERNAKKTYDRLVSALEHDLLSRGANKQTARKQARGAARGYLGNALQTELVFSANVAQWRWMLDQRASVHADAEIRQLFCDALRVLKASRYGDHFSDMSLAASGDGIGEVMTREQR